MKPEKIIYWIATGILCAIMLFSAYMYLFKYDMAAGFYKFLGFPTWIIYPSAVLKILAVVAIISRKSALLKEWAYVGIFFDLLLAWTAHYMVGDGVFGVSAIALIAFVVSRGLNDRVFGATYAAK